MEVVTLKNRGDRRTTGPLNVLGPVYKKRGLPLCEGTRGSSYVEGTRGSSYVEKSRRSQNNRPAKCLRACLQKERVALVRGLPLQAG